tara:strand:+ start:706 stop:1020 length:315 start_codon:yes stop_codon:yes gene_type:complete
MKQSISRHDFANLFEQYNRKENFTYNARLALFDYLEELEEGTGSEMECDIIGLCCEYSEYPSAAEAEKEYAGADDLDSEEEAAAFLRDRTTLIEFEGGIIIQAF